MILWQGKDNINTLLNPDNYFGEHESSMVPMLLFFAGVGFPLIGWLLFLMPFIPFKFFCIPFIPWCIRWAMITLGKEKKIIADYLQQRADEYKAVDEIVHVNQLYSDGLLEYSNGQVAYIVSGFPKGYLNPKKFSAELENFMNELDMFTWDWSLQNAVDEVITEDQLPKLRAYKDKEVIKDRIDFFSYQDDYARTHTSLYRYVFIVYSSKGDWKKLRNYLENLVESEVAQCFNTIEICDKDMVNSLMNRDVCTYLDFIKMLTKKYENNDFKGSKVLWYDSKIPKKYKKKDENTSNIMEERRITEDDK